MNQAKDIGQDTWNGATSDEALKSYLIAGASAALTAGLTAGLDNVANGAVNAGNATGATFGQQLTSALYQTGISTISSTAVQSAVNGDSFLEALENQGINILIGAAGNLGAKYIGSLAHGSLATNPDGSLMINPDGTFVYNAPAINQIEQKLLHALLGCGMAAAGGNDCASGAVSGVVGELTAEFIGDNTNLNDNYIKELAGLSGAFSAIFTGSAVGLDDSEIAANMFSGQRIGKNAAENNYLMPQEKAKLVRELDNCNGNQACQNQVQAKYQAISDVRDKEFDRLYDDCKNDNCTEFNKIHYDLRAELTKKGDAYYKEHPEEFKLLPASKSIFHTFLRNADGSVSTFGENNNTKYIHPVYGYEIVLDGNGNIVTDPLNAGTYNFYNPTIGGIDKSLQGLLGNNDLHIDYDYNPYVDYGNATNNQDPTSSLQRLMRNIMYPGKAMRDSVHNEN